MNTKEHNLQLTMLETYKEICSEMSKLFVHVRVKYSFQFPAIAMIA